MVLYINGVKAEKGMDVKTFRGEPYKLTGWKEPQHSGSTGRVYITDGKFSTEYFPSVVGGEWKDE